MIKIINGELLFKFRARVLNTQTNVGGGVLHIQLPCAVGNTLYVEHLGLGADNVAAGRNVDLYHKDETAQIAPLMNEASIDNAIIRLIEAAHDGTATANTENAIGAPEMPLMVPAGNHLLAVSLTPAQNETLTLTVTGWCKILPVFITTGSGGTPVLSTSYNETV